MKMDWCEYGVTCVRKAIKNGHSVSDIVSELANEQCTQFGREALYGAIAQCSALIDSLRSAGLSFSPASLNIDNEMRVLKINRLLRNDVDAANLMISECVWAIDEAAKKYKITFNEETAVGNEAQLLKVSVVSMPDRQTSTVVKRNENGDIAGCIQVESDMP